MELRFNRYFPLFFASLLLFLSAGCSEYSLVTHKKDIILYPPDKEVEIGSRVAQSFMEAYPPIEDDKVQERIEKIGKKLASVCDRKDIPYQFVVVDLPDKNAVSLPGGYVFISKELVEFCKSDDEIASVLAHEIGHIVAKHGIKRMQASYLALAGVIASAASGNEELTKGVSGSLQALFSAYSKQDEFMADELGAKYMRRAGYNVEAMVDLFKRLDEEERYSSHKRPINYFRTHPYLSERIHRIKANFLKDNASQFLEFVSNSE